MLTVRWPQWWLILSCLLLLAACSDDPAPTAVAEVESSPTPAPPTETVAPTATFTALPPTATATTAPTETATTAPTETPTAMPSPTATATATATATPSPTATAAPTQPPPTQPPPTQPPPPTPVPQTAHTFPETPIQPFDASTFRDYLGRVRDSFRSFHNEMGQFAQTGKPGDCGTFIGWTGLWILQAPGFTNVPTHWQSLYVEYRALLRDVVAVTTEIRPLCQGSGGQVSAETTQAIIDFLTWAYPRTETMVTEAAQIGP